MRPPALRRAAAAALALAGLAVLTSPPAGAATAPAVAPTVSPVVPNVPVMVVLDASGSMNESDAPGPRIDAAKKAVKSLVAGLPGQTQVGLTVYGTRTGSTAADKAKGCTDITTLVPVARLDAARISGAVDGVKASGYTPIGNALRAAAKALPAEGPRSIVLVSDGEDTCAPPAPCDVAKELERQGVDLTIHTVGFKVDATARGQLACVAAATGGTYADAADADQLTKALQVKVDDAITGYTAKGTRITGADQPSEQAPLMNPGQYLDTYARGGAQRRVPRHHEVLHGSVAGGGHPPRRRHPRAPDRAPDAAGQLRRHGVVAGDGRVDLRLRRGQLRQQRRLLPQPGQRRHGDDARPRGRTGPLPRPMRGRRRGHRCSCSHWRHLRRSLPTGRARRPQRAGRRCLGHRPGLRHPSPRPPPADVRCDGDTAHRRFELQRRTRADEWPDLHGHDRHRRGPLRQGPARLGSAPRLRGRGGGAGHADPDPRRRCPRQRLQPRPPGSAHHQPVPDCPLVRRRPGATPHRVDRRPGALHQPHIHQPEQDVADRRRPLPPAQRQLPGQGSPVLTHDVPHHGRRRRLPREPARPTSSGRRRRRARPRRRLPPPRAPPRAPPATAAASSPGRRRSREARPAGLVIGLVAFVALLSAAGAGFVLRGKRAQPPAGTQT